ncbi:hypothetical protein IW261DRAFT_1418893 [Armillaria novae-zelandiae]|uniref:Uncharacterized protein n=1 Tax=Armillaria novae-zelandiae TaxID=153914 RepID=A0AA39PEM1_9AGAR|nr:hypothetical protein IW261DRAFT_1418874 [Armillaria novae-zelandiae]KAK0481914.1 hypothetical protein IW261DRAFT_1418879 [Armillaria novae-zelandiae]KAK0481918.1 hypothetical protein IW261DRAFT_1418883 [Armillaria novae-zelandiae]KAK0481923.1 hypothetical protein IW261DRAFT_1418888 [Armillaria novae-zelandiae]KAK0481928.1 hypothetical protein IW261DRAFT_1418893 [Armillaria novae-zelandiae]
MYGNRGGVIPYAKRRHGTTVALDSHVFGIALILSLFITNARQSSSRVFKLFASPDFNQKRYNGRQKNQGRLKTTALNGRFGSFGLEVFNTGSSANYTKFEASFDTPAVPYMLKLLHAEEDDYDVDYQNELNIVGPANSL